ncbi:MAG: HAMP domain-containing protein [Candidatus Omnitrophica bacterium]|nr:HAMP domain-containing protein [Candidatus Omnitrophota bacterium]
MSEAPERGRFRRRHYLVNKEFQIRFTRNIISYMMLVVLVASGVVYFAFWYTINKLGIVLDELIVAIFVSVGVALMAEAIFVLPLVVVASIFLTHTVAGPLVRIKRVLSQMGQGNFSQRISLRKGDELGDLAETVNQLAQDLERRQGHP